MVNKASLRSIMMLLTRRQDKLLHSISKEVLMI